MEYKLKHGAPTLKEFTEWIELLKTDKNLIVKPLTSRSFPKSAGWTFDSKYDASQLWTSYPTRSLTISAYKISYKGTKAGAGWKVYNEIKEFSEKAGSDMADKIIKSVYEDSDICLYPAGVEDQYVILLSNER